MAEVKESEQPSNNLNELLEDALEDLLLEDDTNVDTKGKPNIEESLKKITEVGKAQTCSEDNNKKSESKSTSEKNRSQTKPVAGSSSSHKVIDEEEMNRFFSSMTEKLQEEMPKMDIKEAQARINESVPQIFDLMQNLLSKELLYPALKDLVPKYDEWIKKNLATLSKEDRRRYKKQIRKIHEIIDVFDDESLDNQEKFEKNLELMEQMQALGAPPEELRLPEGAQRCSVI